jgi:tRNA threonylcarbamoyladenosine dehydratase
MDAYLSRFGGLGRLYGEPAMERLRKAHVCVIGIGGVGTWTAEALARSGVGTLTLIDMDDVCITNTNRQLPAMEGHIGRSKVTVMAERLRRINPECVVNEVHDFFTVTTAETLLSTRFDYVVDAIDDPAQKALMIVTCQERSIPIITVGGAGGRWDPTQIQVADLTKAFNDGLLRRVRKTLRRVHDYSRDGSPWDVACVFSRERAIFPTAEGGLCRTGRQSGNLTLDCNSGFGTASFVTGVYGFSAASLVVRTLADPPEPEPDPSR